MDNNPERTNTYRGAFLDSTHWDGFRPRRDDIVISTSMKAGTTWMQRICAALVFQSPDLVAPLDALSPWLDLRIMPREFKHAILESQTHRRFIKSHIPLDALPFFDEVKYIVVCRDARDVVLSAFNHYCNQQPWTFEGLNARTGAEFLAVREKWNLETPPEAATAYAHQEPWEGESVPVWDEPDVHEFIGTWLTKGMYPGELDGAPYWSHFRHLQSWWDFRRLPNILFVHYSDLLADLDAEMRRVAEFLEIEVREDVWDTLVDAATFKTMKAQADMTAPARGTWRDATRFFNRGVSGGWREVLTSEELALYDAAVRQSLDPVAARWMEHGTLKAGNPVRL